MSFLIAKIAFLLIIAALLGAWFMWWWIRRHYQEVTSEYTQLTGDWQNWRKGLDAKLNGLENKLGAAPPVDLDPLHSKLDGVVHSIRSIDIPKPVATDLSSVLAAIGAIPGAIPAAKAVDLEPMSARMAALEKTVAGIHIPAPKDVDLAPLASKLADLQAKIEGIHIPQPKDVDLSAVHAKLAALDQAVGNIKIPAIPAMPAVDFAPTQAHIAEVERAVKAIHIPQPKDVDLAPLTSKISALEAKVAAIHIPAQKDVDLNPVNAKLAALDQAIANIKMPVIPPAASIDLGPTHARIAEVERAVRAIVIPPATQVDLSVVLNKLAALQSKLDQPPPKVVVAAPTPAPVQAPAQVIEMRKTVRAGSRNLLSRAAFGKPDDLKRIKGVATVMEKMMHDIGVYYFWQVADWDAKDIAHADAQLTVFKGRILRDEWVKQAKLFAREANTAKKPDGF